MDSLLPSLGRTIVVHYLKGVQVQNKVISNAMCMLAQRVRWGGVCGPACSVSLVAASAKCYCFVCEARYLQQAISLTICNNGVATTVSSADGASELK